MCAHGSKKMEVMHWEGKGFWQRIASAIWWDHSPHPTAMSKSLKGTLEVWRNAEHRKRTQWILVFSLLGLWVHKKKTNKQEKWVWSLEKIFCSEWPKLLDSYHPNMTKRWPNYYREMFSSVHFSFSLLTGKVIGVNVSQCCLIHFPWK